MIDLTNAKWELSKEEKYAIDWFDKNGFDVKIERQYMSKTKFTVFKDGVTDEFELFIQNNPTISRYMEQYKKSFELLCKLKGKTQK